MIYLELFFSFLQIGLLSFGGGYAAMPLVEKHAFHAAPRAAELVTVGAALRAAL